MSNRNCRKCFHYRVCRIIGNFETEQIENPLYIQNKDLVEELKRLPRFMAGRCRHFIDGAEVAGRIKMISSPEEGNLKLLCLCCGKEISEEEIYCTFIEEELPVCLDCAWEHEVKYANS